VKDKFQSHKPQSYILCSNSSSENLILNIVIAILFVVIIFMSYSLFRKITASTKTAEANVKGLRKDIQIQVEVLNGCGVEGIADRFTDYLRKNNIDVVQMSNYISYDIEKSIVIDRTGNMANAYKIADVLGIDKKSVIQQINKNYFLDASIIIGKDFNNLKPYLNQ